VSGVVGVGGGIFAWPDASMLNTRVASIVKLWLWATPGLLIIAGLGSAAMREQRQIQLLAWSALLTFVAYLFVRPDQGHGWGYRYFQSAWGVLPILAGCAMQCRGRFSAELVPFAGAAVMLSLMLLVPFQLWQIEDFVSGHLAQIPPAKEPGNNVYFVEPVAISYLADLIQIDPLLRDRDLVLASRGAKLNEALVRENWPGATRTHGLLRVDHWYLGPVDVRRADARSGQRAHFDLHFTNSGP